MNKLKGRIKNIDVNGCLSLVGVEIGDRIFSVIVIDTPETVPYLKNGNMIDVIFKETEVIIGKGTTHPISLQNRLIGWIRSIDSGRLLSKLKIETSEGEIVSVITTNAVNQLELKTGMEVTAMIKTNEIMLSE
jgi:molybdate transport system regulatory protein